MSDSIHFWCPDPLAEAVGRWDPDDEPSRFASTVGHALLELAVRLRREGLDIALGERPPRRTRLVVAVAGPLRKDPRQLEAVLRATAVAGGRIVLIRADTPLAWRLPLRPIREVMPQRGLAVAPHQVWLPQLPQRGLLPRRPAPLDRIATVTLKCNPVTLPEGLRDGSVEDALARQGVRLWIDMPERTDGSDQTWHDFAAADAVLCARAAADPAWAEAKPPTKLVNAWAAGCLPLAARETPYLELGRDGTDVVFLDCVEELPDVVDRLNAEPGTLAQLARGVEERRVELSPARVLASWRQLLEDAGGERPSAARAARARLLAERTRLGAVGAHASLAAEQRLRRLRHSRA